MEIGNKNNCPRGGGLLSGGIIKILLGLQQIGSIVLVSALMT